MALITMPTTPAFKRSTFELDWNTRKFESPFTRTTQRLLLDGQYWMAEYTLPRMSEETALAWRGFFTALRGNINTFNAPDPTRERLSTGNIDDLTHRLATNGITVSGGHVDNGTHTIKTQGWIVNHTVARAGDLFSIEGEVKVLTQNARTGADGSVTLHFEPALMATNVHSGTVLSFENLTVEMFLLEANPISRWISNEHGVYQELRFKAREALV